MKTHTFAFALCVLVGACSGSGTSTTARDSEEEGETVSDTDPSGTASDPTDSPTTMSSESDPTDATDPTDPTDPTDDTDVAETDASDGSTTANAETGSDSSGGDTGAPVTIEGVWLSEGDDVAPLLVQLTGAVSITATFDDGTFSVLTLDDEGQEVSQAGVYAVDDTDLGELKTIILEQSSPQTITVEGIYEIDDSTDPPTMRYEVVQTVPSVGAEVPSPEAGFGGTNIGADLTQVFVLQ